MGMTGRVYAGCVFDQRTGVDLAPKSRLPFTQQMIL